MPSFGKRSKAALKGVDPRLCAIMEAAVRVYDCAVLDGVRTAAQQGALYAQGRTAPGAVVTNIDGVTRLSNHQVKPGDQLGRAVDVVPYPIDWDDAARFHELSLVIKGAASALGYNVQWGGDWERFKDLPHWELRA